MPDAPPTDAKRPADGGAPSWMPALDWGRACTWSTLRGDVVAGVTLAAYLIPAGMGDATLAGLPPQAGLYACLFSGLVYWLFGSSRLTAVTVTSALSLLIGTSVGSMAQGDPARFAALASATALLTGGIALVAWKIRAGVLMNFISEAVLTGFKCGVGLTLVSAQLPKLLGFDAAHGDFWHRAAHFARNIGATHPASLAVGGAALALLVAGKVLWKNRPVALFVVVSGILLATFLPLGSWGVRLLGEVPREIPAPTLPPVRWHDLNDLLPLALAAFFLGAVETTAIGRMFATRTRARFDVNREFLALGAANVAAGLGGGFPVSGGMSQSLVNASAGARTPLSGLVSAVTILLAVLFFAPQLRLLPEPVLAAVVLTAVAGLLNVSTLRSLFRRSRTDFLTAMIALAGVLEAGLLRGVLIGGIISLVQVLRRAASPHVAVLGRIPGTRRFSDRERHPDNEPVPGLMILRPEMSLVYFNAEHVREAVLARVEAAPEKPKRVLLDLSAAPQMDLQSAEALRQLSDELEALGIDLRAVEAHAEVRDRLRAEGLQRTLGKVSRFISIADAVDAFHDEHRPPAADI